MSAIPSSTGGQNASATAHGGSPKCLHACVVLITAFKHKKHTYSGKHQQQSVTACNGTGGGLEWKITRTIKSVSGWDNSPHLALNTNSADSCDQCNCNEKRHLSCASAALRVQHGAVPPAVAGFIRHMETKPQSIYIIVKQSRADKIVNCKIWFSVITSKLISFTTMLSTDLWIRTVKYPLEHSVGNRYFWILNSTWCCIVL